jgi:uncharacterized protein (DUF4415 family)
MSTVTRSGSKSNGGQAAEIIRILSARKVNPSERRRLENYKPSAQRSRFAAHERPDIDYSDIPPLTEEQLASMVRFRDRQPKTLISVRLELPGDDWSKSKGKGHLTLINDILANDGGERRA